MRLEYEGLHKSEAITMSGARFYNNPAGFAMNRYAYYVCYKCKKVRVLFVLCGVHKPSVEHRSIGFKQSSLYIMAEEAFRKRTVGSIFLLRMSLFTINRMKKHG